MEKEIKTMKKFLISVVFGISVLSFGQINVMQMRMVLR